MLKKNYIGKTEVNTTMPAESFAYYGPVIFGDFDMNPGLDLLDLRKSDLNAIVQENLSEIAMTTAGKNKALDKNGIIATPKPETEVQNNKGN
ncbi:hypothetical protein B9Z55_022306 [Caenorhabditis nigoni]|nr:hypothetical protein B9Z55_022306 [Caenorhabditis nigoni]